MGGSDPNVYQKQGDDGWYFKHPVTGEEVGPFPTSEDARLHLHAAGEG